MYADPLALLLLVAGCSCLAFLLGRRVERRRSRDEDIPGGPPTARQLAFIADLADELGGTVPSPRTRAEAATMIDDLLRERRRRQDDDDDELNIPSKAPPR